ncbi:MAG: S53 family peptidase [Acidobacteriota bacterium]|nr:S53 family peptidase [Acidobacteriota bacterium]MDE3043503.1 S53 family peptidase [Acidobacteriota bacterium]MDE3106822.1 S53 family peptidase [Acidobacteriota bacterium]MDE3222959.1 S53 family peptidase [Acidobacteriota bacterium]
MSSRHFTRRTLRALTFSSAALLAFGALALPAVGSASTSNNIVYQVTPLAKPDTSSLAASALTPGYCVANFGLACYGPAAFHQAYQIPWTINGVLAGTGQQVAIVDAFGSPTVASDLATYDAAFNLPSADLHVYYPDGKPTFGPSLKHGSLQAGWAEETSLDVQTVHDLAPGARINLIVASSPNGNDINVATRYAIDNHLGDVLSMSFGAPEAAIAGGGNNLQLQQAHANFAQAVAEKIGLFASSGDSGASNGYNYANALFPASDPNVTSTGGTNLFTPSLNSLTSTDYSYAGETTWNDGDPATCPFGCPYGAFGATGGASSSVFAAPSYQSALGLSARATSDVSFNASVYTATLIYLGFLGAGSSGFYFFGGTSEASPAWAAIAADLNQGHGSDLGALNPTLYSLAANPSTYAQDFHDVTLGNNELPFPGPGSNAGSGYDLPTGLGSPIVSGLMSSLAPNAMLGFSQP